MIEDLEVGERRANDPVSLVWKADPPDREVVGLVVSCLAYGRVALLLRAAEDAISRAGGSDVASFARDATHDELHEAFHGFKYRMTAGEDLADLFAGIGQTLREHGSLERAFVESGADHTGRASGFVRSIRAGRVRDDVVRGFRYLLPDPADGSASKRLHLYLRWMVRGPDEVDLGLWKRVSPGDLIMPLDTHTSRLARYLGLTERSVVDGRAAAEVTAALRALDAHDPLKYDFPLCHLGISGRCIHRRSEEHCPSCPIEPVCALE